MKRALTAIALGILGLWVGPSWASAQTSFRFVAWGGSRGVSSGVDTAVLSNVSNQVKGISPQPVFTIFEGDLCYSWDSSCTSTGSGGWKYAVNNGSPRKGTFHITCPLEVNHHTHASQSDLFRNCHSRATVTAIRGGNF